MMKTVSALLTAFVVVLVVVCLAIPSPKNGGEHRRSELPKDKKKKLSVEMQKKFHHAIYDCEIEEVKKFVSLGIELDIEIDVNGGWSPLQRAAAGRDFEIVRILVENGASVDWVGKNNITTPLHWSIQDGSADIAEYLLDCGADPNRECDDEWTALDALYGYRFVGRLRTLPIASFMRLEDRLVELGTVENVFREPEDKAHSRFSPNSLAQQTD